MRYIFSLILIAFFCFETFADLTFSKGYIIYQNGDTLFGYLQNQNSRNASKQCIFKEKINDDPQIITPFKISGYKFIDGKYYVSKNIGVDSLNPKEVFLEFLIKGIASIYYYADKEGEHYYIEKEPYGLIELTEKLSTYNGVKKTPKKYYGKLTLLMDDCNEIKPEINKAQLSHKSLISLAKNYHSMVCSTEDCIVFEKHDYEVKTQFSFFTGLSKISYNFGNMLHSDYGNCFQLGAAFTIRKVSVSNDNFSISFKAYFEKDSKYNMTPNDNDGYSYFVNYNGVEYHLNKLNLYNTVPNLPVELDIIAIKTPLIVNYNYSIKNTSFFIGIGFSNRFILNQNKDYVDLSFYNYYGKSINSYLLGGLINFGIEREIFSSQLIFINISCEYLFNSHAVQQTLRLRENQYSFQFGIYII